MTTDVDMTMTRFLIDWKYGALEGGMEVRAKNEMSARSMLFAELRKLGIVSSPMNIYNVKVTVKAVG